MTDTRIAAIMGFIAGFFVGGLSVGSLVNAEPYWLDHGAQTLELRAPVPEPSPSPFPVRHCFALAANSLRHVKYEGPSCGGLTFRADRMREKDGRAIWVFVHDGQTYRIGTPPKE